MIEIALTFDDKFWAPAYATMRSVCLTAHHPGNIRFHLLTDGITPEHRAALETIASDYGATLNLVNLAASNVLGTRIVGFPAIRMQRFHPVIYARLFLGELLPSDVTKVLYLDSDTFVRSDIAVLYDTDLEGKAIAAALQPDRMHCIAGKDLRSRTAFSMAEPYFNSGVMLIDMAQYRGVDFSAVLKASLPQSEIEMFYYDQDIVNFCFKGRILELDYRWNLQNPEPAHEILNPHILHYSANPKPWFIWSRVAFKRTYRHLMTNEYFYQYRRERMIRLVRKLFRLG
ncbi:Lipopolysaccharide biosynthesis protein, LPS:glycosyltransferase [Devosia sp. YR412]|uniref:glycosyltransferase family 8 protein n=1 Tax=Devosia sp. YR412 TaxID=1881030 RepID=UPI0008C02E3C|nr:glycosyltransferase family 8 protein [Devosia sp. YR412]SEQ22358.1 Lipopolysaccharide biosynthesis protein, LPS:glycosyltransferase [Devosia sp. YR412]